MWHVWKTGQVHTGFWWRNLREKEHLEDPDVDGRTILKCIFRNGMGGMDWIDMVPHKGRWQALVNAAMNLPVSQHAGNFLTS
jgi:hypothetical protein